MTRRSSNLGFITRQYRERLAGTKKISNSDSERQRRTADDADDRARVDGAARTPREITMSRLTERQQLAAAMAESMAAVRPSEKDALSSGKLLTGAGRMKTTTATPMPMSTKGGRAGRNGHGVKSVRDVASGLTPRTPGGDGGGEATPTRDLYAALQSNKTKSRVSKELASLAPWAWDPLVGKHAPGASALRDFSEVVTDKTIVASAGGATGAVKVRTFERRFEEEWTASAKKEKTSATPAPKTRETTGRETKRARVAMTETVTPVALSKTLEKVSRDDKSNKSASTRATTRGAAISAGKEKTTKSSTNSRTTRGAQLKEIPVNVPIAKTTVKANKTKNAAAKATVVDVPKSADIKRGAATKRKSNEEPKNHIETSSKRVADEKTVEETKLHAAKQISQAERTISRLNDKEARRRAFVLDALLARTYVKAIKKPIVSTVKPSKRLLDAFRAFSSARVKENEAFEPRALKFGSALETGLQVLRDRDQAEAGRGKR